MRTTKITVLTKIRKALYISLGSIDRLFKRNNNIFILCYHGISNDDWRYSVDLDVFARQLNYLVKNYSPVSLEDVDLFIHGKKKIEKPSFAITIDDGYRDILKLRGLFKKINIKPTIFVLSNRIGVNRKELDTSREFLTKKELFELQKEGWIIGCHSATHSDFYNLSEKEIEEEIITSKKDLEDELGIKIKYFSYPKGRYTNKVLDAIRKAGYELGLSMNDGFIDKKVDKLLVPRVGVDRTHSFTEFKTLFLPLNIKARKLIKYFNYGR